jgi:hypothetical protein
VANGTTTTQLPKDPDSTPRLIVGGLVVLVALAAIVVALGLVLSHYPVAKSGAGQGGGTSSDTSSTSVVAIITPIAAALTAIAGLYFGVSASGSARGQSAAAQGKTADLGQMTAKAAALLSTDQAKQAGILKDD